jgi:hypothetical protein
VQEDEMARVCNAYVREETCNTSSENLTASDHFRDSIRSWKGKVKLDLKETGYEGVVWIELAHDKL